MSEIYADHNHFINTAAHTHSIYPTPSCQATVYVKHTNDKWRCSYCGSVNNYENNECAKCGAPSNQV